MSSTSLNYLLGEDRMPRAWYNLAADLPTPPAPVLHPGTGQPIGPADLEPIFPMAIIAQEVSTERWIEIPDPVRDVYRMWRPSPLFRAHGLERETEHRRCAGLLQQSRRREAPSRARLSTPLFLAGLPARGAFKCRDARPVP